MFHEGFLEEPSVGRIILIPTYIFHFAPQPFRLKARLSGSACPDPTGTCLSGSAERLVVERKSRSQCRRHPVIMTDPLPLVLHS